jgi:hypothetical protein
MVMPREEDEGFVIEFTPDEEFINLMKETQAGLVAVRDDLQLALDALNDAKEANVELQEAANKVLSVVPKTDT